MEVNIPYMDPMGYLRQIVDVDRKQVCFFIGSMRGRRYGTRSASYMKSVSTTEGYN